MSVKKSPGTPADQEPVTHLTLKAEPGTFIYRGLPIKPAFSDRKSKALEKAMRAAASKFHVFAEQ